MREAFDNFISAIKEEAGLSSGEVKLISRAIRGKGVGDHKQADLVAAQQKVVDAAAKYLSTEHGFEGRLVQTDSGRLAYFKPEFLSRFYNQYGEGGHEGLVAKLGTPKAENVQALQFALAQALYGAAHRGSTQQPVNSKEHSPISQQSDFFSDTVQEQLPKPNSPRLRGLTLISCSFALVKYRPSAPLGDPFKYKRPSELLSTNNMDTLLPRLFFSRTLAIKADESCGGATAKKTCLLLPLLSAVSAKSTIRVSRFDSSEDLTLSPSKVSGPLNPIF